MLRLQTPVLSSHQPGPCRRKWLEVGWLPGGDPLQGLGCGSPLRNWNSAPSSWAPCGRSGAPCGKGWGGKGSQEQGGYFVPWGGAELVGQATPPHTCAPSPPSSISSHLPPLPFPSCLAPSDFSLGRAALLTTQTTSLADSSYFSRPPSLLT